VVDAEGPITGPVCRVATAVSALLMCLTTWTALLAAPPEARSGSEHTRLLEEGRYLAGIGVCEACHTPPDVPAQKPSAGDRAALDRERRFRTEPDWFKYLDPTGGNRMAGGVPFILRFSSDSSGVVYSRNITSDAETGLGSWTDDEIIEVIRSGKRKDGTSLFLFPPHSFFKNLTREDCEALVVYLRSLPAKRNLIPARSLPFPTQPASDVTKRKTAPRGRSLDRALYLTSALVGCRECHSHTEAGTVMEFTGGDASDPFLGVFRLGPDLPLRPDEKGFSTFPYPGYALLYAPNLTRLGLGGDESHVPLRHIVRAMRQGIGFDNDEYGRPELLHHVMLWQFYATMRDEDAYSIAEYLKTLRYVPHDVEPSLVLFGEDWKAAFEHVFHEAPSVNDKAIFGKVDSP